MNVFAHRNQQARGMPGRDCRAFTLVELLVVLLISVSVFALVLPAYSQSATRFELKRTARELTGMLRQTRNSAVTQGRRTAVRFDLRSGSFTSGVTGGARSMRDGVQLTLHTGIAGGPLSAGDEIAFYADGSSTGGQVVIAAAGARYRIDVDWLTGRVDVHD